MKKHHLSNSSIDNKTLCGRSITENISIKSRGIFRYFVEMRKRKNFSIPRMAKYMLSPHYCKRCFTIYMREAIK